MVTRMPAYGQKGPTQLPQSLHEHDRAHSALTAQPFVEPANNEERKTLREGGRQLVGGAGPSVHHLPSVQRTAFPSVSGHGFDRHARATAARLVSGLPAGSHCLSPRHRHAGPTGPEARPPPLTFSRARRRLSYRLSGPTSPWGVQPATRWGSVRRLAAHSDRSPPHLSRAQPGSRLSRHRRGLSSRDSLRLQRPDRSLECPVARGIHLRRLAGPGSGQFNPIGRPINLPQDVAFHRLKEPDEPWPLRPRTTKEAPVNPDPLYPKRLGYRFAGYDLDADDVPTFHYQYGAVRIEDRITPEATREGALSALSKPSNPSNRSSEDAPRRAVAGASNGLWCSPPKNRKPSGCDWPRAPSSVSHQRCAGRTAADRLQSRQCPSPGPRP